MTDKRWQTVAQVAKQLQVHQETVRRWLRDGRLEGRNFGGKTGYRIRQEDLEKFLNEDPHLGRIATREPAAAREVPRPG
jgi:excisionase family DNA binding protein